MRIARTVEELEESLVSNRVLSSDEVKLLRQLRVTFISEKPLAEKE